MIVIDRSVLSRARFFYITHSCAGISSAFVYALIWKHCNGLILFYLQLRSIAGMVRTEYDSSSSRDMKLRTALLFRVAKELKWLSDIHNLCIVVINQVSRNFKLVLLVCSHDNQ